MGKGTEPPKCKICGTQHWGICLNHDAKGAIFDQAPSAASRGAIDATYRPTKSTAARKDGRGPNQLGTDRVIRRDQPINSGNQAPPVDPIIGKRRGRPQTIADLKSYKADKERERRARLKAQ